MNKSIFFVLILLNFNKILMINSSELINKTIHNSYNSSCSTNDFCENNLVCKNETCKCPIGHIWSFDQSKCISFENGFCINSFHCQDYDENRICFYDEKCKCKNGYQSDSLCADNANKSSYGELCNYDNDCDSQQFKCVNSQCKCPIGYIWSIDSKQCIQFRNEFCNSSIKCQDLDPNRICFNDICQCRNGYKDEPIGSLCKSVFGSKCNSNSQCDYYIEKSFCFSNQCICNLFYTNSNNLTECQPTVCSSDNHCHIRLINSDHEEISYTESYCDLSSNSCQCKEGYHYTYKGCTKGTDNSTLEITTPLLPTTSTESATLTTTESTISTTTKSTESTTSEPKLSYNKPCLKGDYNHCDSTVGLTCTNSLCKCKIGYIWSKTYKKCVSFNIGYCAHDYECQDQDPNSLFYFKM